MYGGIAIYSKVCQARRLNFVYNGAEPGYSWALLHDNVSQHPLWGGGVNADHRRT